MNKWTFLTVVVVAIATAIGVEEHQKRAEERARCAELAAQYQDLRATIDRRIAGLQSASIETVRANKPQIEELDKKTDALAEQMKPCLTQ